MFAFDSTSRHLSSQQAVRLSGMARLDVQGTWWRGNWWRSNPSAVPCVRLFGRDS